MSAPLGDLMGNALTEPIATPDDENIEVEVMDDRPEEDRVPPKDPDRSGDFDPDAEVEEVSGRAGKRISKLKYEYHEERRSKEAAERLREEAVNYAQQVSKENVRLNDLLQRGEKVLLSEIQSRTDSDLSKARNQYKVAYEAGDADTLLAAQEALNQSQYEKTMAANYQSSLPSQQAQQPPPQPPAQTDPKLTQWLQDNEWFGKDKEMTSLAYGVHDKLLNDERLDPRTDEYYARLTDRVREVFPTRFENEKGASEPSASSRASTVVAPANRSPGSPRQVRITESAVKLAKRLGLTKEQYAKQVLKEMRS